MRPEIDAVLRFNELRSLFCAAGMARKMYDDAAYERLCLRSALFGKRLPLAGAMSGALKRISAPERSQSLIRVSGIEAMRYMVSPVAP